MCSMGQTLAQMARATIPPGLESSGGLLSDGDSACELLAPNLSSVAMQQRVLDMNQLRYYAYGVALPIVCGVGIVGNLLNILVLTRKNMKGVAYCYMRGYAVTSLVALILAIPFCIRMLTQNESSTWQHYSTAFYFARLELFLGNGFIGLSALLLVALTIERYISVCHPVRAHNQTKKSSRVWLILVLLFVCTMLFYLPYTLRSYVVECTGGNGSTYYHTEEDKSLTHSVYYLVYKWTLKIVYKIAPIVVIAYLNSRIYWSYRSVCRRRLTMIQVNREQKQQHSDEHRLMMLLVSTATLFFICNLPMVLLSVSFTTSLRFAYPFQIFRAVSNILEIVNYSVSFYIYCMFTKEFRDTFLKTIRFREFSSQQTSRISRTEV